MDAVPAPKDHQRMHRMALVFCCFTRFYARDSLSRMAQSEEVPANLGAPEPLPNQNPAEGQTAPAEEVLTALTPRAPGGLSAAYTLAQADAISCGSSTNVKMAGNSVARCAAKRRATPGEPGTSSAAYRVRGGTGSERDPRARVPVAAAQSRGVAVRSRAVAVRARRSARRARPSAISRARASYGTFGNLVQVRIVGFSAPPAIVNVGDQLNK